MKRILLIAAMIVVLIASPVVADAPAISLMVDYKDIPQKGIIIDGTTYVPVRVVGESMGATVKWYPQTQTVFILSDAEPVVEGDDKFKKMIADSMELLRVNDSTAYKMVCDNVRKIGISDNVVGRENENALAFATSGTEQINFTHKGMDSEYFVPQYIASVIVHETVHCAQGQCLSSQVDLMKRYEAIAYMYQLNTLGILNAPQWMKDGCVDSMTRATK